MPEGQTAGGCACHARRQFLLTSAALGGLALLPDEARASGTLHDLNGTAFINHRAARAGSGVKTGDLLVTSHNSSLTFSLGGDAFLLGERTSLELRGLGERTRGLRMHTGSVLCHFTSGHRYGVTPAMTVHLREAATLYLEAYPEEVYCCVCQGAARLTLRGLRQRPMDITGDISGGIAGEAAGGHSGYVVRVERARAVSVGATERHHHSDEQIDRLRGWPERHEKSPSGLAGGAISGGGNRYTDQ